MSESVSLKGGFTSIDQSSSIRHDNILMRTECGEVSDMPQSGNKDENHPEVVSIKNDITQVRCISLLHVI